MSIFKSATRVVEETRTSKAVTKIPMAKEVQAELATKANKRGSTPTLKLIQRGIDKANLSKADLALLEKAVSTATRGDVYWPCNKIKQGLKGDVSLVKEGLADLIKLVVADSKPAKAPKAPKGKAAKTNAKKTPAKTPAKAEKAPAKAEKASGLNAKKIALIEKLIAQNETIISLLK